MDKRLSKLGMVLADEMTRAISNNKCESFNEGFLIHKNLDNEMMNLLKTEGNADAVSKAFEKNAKKEKWAKNLYRIVISVDEKNIWVYAYTRLIISGEYLKYSFGTR